LLAASGAAAVPCRLRSQGPTNTSTTSDLTVICPVPVDTFQSLQSLAVKGMDRGAEPFAPGVIYDRAGLTTTMYVRRATDVAF
jgi:hypothetical protein